LVVLVFAAAGLFGMDLTHDRALIVAPAGAATEAARLAGGMRAAGCAAPEVVSDDAAAVAGRPLIILGNAPENRLLRRLYYEAYDFTDYAWPGAGNAVVRTIPDPLATGADAIVVGASDAAGLALAVDTFLDEVKKSGCKLGYTNRVAGHLTDPYAAHLKPDFDWAATESGPGSWDYERAIAECGLGYLYTGNEAYLPLYRDQLLSFYQRRVVHMASGSQMHGFVHWLINTWDLIRPHPFFDADREKIDNALLAILRSKEGPARIANTAKRYEIRGNHGTRTALDGYFGGRWAWRRLHLEEGKTWMDIAAAYFKPQLASSKPDEDSWGHQWNASLINTAEYALATHNDAYFASEPLRQAAERALIAHSHRESGPHVYLALVAAATGDSRYLSLTKAVDPALSAKSFLPGYGGQDEFLRAFAFFHEAQFHPGATGVAIAPLDRLWFDTIDKISGAGIFARTVPFEETYDKICFREGYGANDLYLLLDGLSGGNHSYQDANCIKRYVEGGVDWLGTGQPTYGASTVREENGVYIAFDGAGPGHVHRFARKLYARAEGEYYFAASALTGVGEADWERHIIRRKGQWTVVIDRALARRAGEMLIERHWWLKGNAHDENGWLVSRGGSSSKPVFLHLGSAGIQDAILAGRGRLERIRTTANTVEIGAILYVDKQPASGRYRLIQSKRGWVVEGEGKTVLVGLGKAEEIDVGQVVDLRQLGTLPPVDLPRQAPDWHTYRLPVRITAIEPAGTSFAAGDASGNVLWNEVSVKRPKAISALHFYPGGKNAAPGLCIGEEDGTLSLVNEDGSVRWSLKMPWIPMPFVYWSEGKSRAREIDSADLDGDGTPEILVANADRHLWAFDAAGKQLFRSSVEWGVFTGLTVAPVAGQLRILGGTSHPSIFGRLLVFDAQGKVGTAFSRPDLVNWSFPAEMRDVRVLNGQILTAVETSMRQLVVYRENGKIAWEADVAGGPAALAVVANRVISATGAGYLLAFDGAGARQWATFFGDRARLLAVRAGYLEAVTDHAIVRFDANGKPIGRMELPAAVTATPRPGSHRSPNRLLAGLADGTIIAF
jgi:hypothetical protein